MANDPPFHNPFGKLGGKRQPEPPRAPGRAVVRYERKGHGGKEMTRVEKLELSANELERWLKEAKSALGCGGVVENGSLLLQGDQRERLRAWLKERGVAKVTVS